MRTCPSKIIHPDKGQSGVLGFLSPVVRYETDYCKEECNACLRSCPYEAIKVQWYEEAYESFPAVEPSKCNGCGACEAVCPTGELKAIKVWNFGLIHRGEKLLLDLKSRSCSIS
jgi:formate hydrogenlyase subunit 6/NADH:ubiquinone oxidoreductase subunit I